MKYKVLALVLCLAMLLTMTLPGTLAMPVDAENATSDTSSETGEVGKEEQNILPATLDEEEKQEEEKQEETPAVNPEPVENPEEKGEEKPAEGNSEEKGEEEPEEKSEEGDAPEGETGEKKDAEDVVVSAEKLVELAKLVADLLATRDETAFFAVFDTMTLDQFNILSEEQLALINAHLAAIEPKPAPAIDVDCGSAPVESEVYTPAKSYTNVAPFGAPVVGK